ncbi:phycobilisome rod-core linker polypeptide [Synechococcus sp. Tobar12-5m-g]|jgi:hypothetical protein|uniref:phycobilisome rod-core linker polypeptide n=1 Tax=unclassified Synechococcus TaxID=2626047 RepID=UPI0020CE2A84|nr:MULTISPECIES: phycobilisome rod-core linker polypeptide [unclassified Synechococcus]MCP9772967.1 phycobilisome rod-core linker polypeptide [Synechococcus sp. Tobar12-5m-g]MCP9873884.1 phycobilisome rod-core linker polypeptide [Synechococcus sp. Cruz CV-v-12]
MALLQAPYLGIERFANDRDKENWANASEQDKNTIIRSVYRQVLGQQYLMDNERLSGAESLFRNNYLTVSELVRTVAKSGLYRSRFFENCNAYRFIELNHKHLLGRAPQNKAEMLHHFTILQDQGYDAEIDSYIDSSEYQNRFGPDGVPYLHGWDYSIGHEGRQFSWLMQLARGAGASVRGDAAGNQFRLGNALHQDRAVSVVGPNASGGSFRARIGSGSGDGDIGTPRRSPSQAHRQEGLCGASGSRGTSDGSRRIVTISVSGLACNDVVRSADYVMRVPYTRMNEALRRVNRMGGTVRNVTVN